MKLYCYDNLGTFIAKKFSVLIKMILSIILLMLYLGFTFTYTFIAYNSDQSGSYISFDINSGICSQNPYEITNVFELDINGSWDTSKYFLQSQSIMSYHFERFAKTTSEYSSFIMSSKEVISNVTRSFKYRTLPYNLAYLMSWQYSIDDVSKSHKVKFNGDPAYVFDRLIL